MKRIIILIILVFISSIAFASGEKEEMKAETQTVLKVALEEGRMADVGRFVANIYQESNPSIKIEVIGIPWDAQYEKLLTVLSSEVYTYDVIEFTPDWGAAFVKSGWLIPLDKWWDESDEYYNDFLLVDLLCKFQGAPSNLSGTYYGLPFNSDVKMLIYRKDLYDQHGLKEPKTWDEFVYNCKKLHNPEKDFYGFGYPASGEETWTQVVVHLWASGCTLFDDNLRPTFYSSKNLEAYDKLIKTAHLIGTPGMYETGYTEENELMASGKVGQIIQWMPAAVGTIEDPDSSKVVGKLGYAPVYGGGTRGTGWAVGIPNTSPNKEEAFNFIKFLCNPEMCKESLIRFTNSLVRKSMINDDELLAKFSWIPGDIKALETAREIPKIPEAWPIYEVIGEETIKALQGMITSAEALKNIDSRVTTMLSEAGYYD